MENFDKISRDLISEIECLDSLTVRSHYGGGNNKVFILDINGTPKYVMKQYFRHESDTRDRFLSEWKFLNYAKNSGISCVPNPVISDPRNGIAIIEYIEGQKVTPEKLNRDHISQALDFFISLNKNNLRDDRAGLQAASESCFSMRDHLVCVNRRISKLLQIPKYSEVDRFAYKFIKSELVPLWGKIQTDILDQKKANFFRMDEHLPEKDICISPSDFGFHNALETRAGRLIFIDFEYAGWDDPVKMICDFFCQPEVPIPHSYLPMFSKRVIDHLDTPESHYQRLEVLLPVHSIKWCCIILNEFLPGGKARRLFANEGVDMDMKKHTQLKKAKEIFKTVRMTIG